MPTGRIRPTLIAFVVVAAVLAPATGAVAQTAQPDGGQPSYDVLRIEQDGTVMPYNIWVDWLPLIVTTPDNGAWVFFSAQSKRGDGSLGTKRLYAARFDPHLGVWSPGRAMPGGEIQFGPAAVVDSKGVVHVVYSDRRTADAGVYSTLVYTHSNAQGGWEAPIPVAADPNAGHQMMPSLTVDGSDRLYLMWRDQRSVDPVAREALSANADVFASDYVDGAWSSPTQVSQRPGPDVNAGWPHIVLDGDRLIGVWSVYQGTAEAQEQSAKSVVWSTRPVSDPRAWSAPQPLIEQQDNRIGGRLVDIVVNPGGGATLLFGQFKDDSNSLFLRRLAAGGTEFGEPVPLGTGDFGFWPNLAIGPDGNQYVVFTNGRGDVVDVGVQKIAAESTEPGAPINLTESEEGLQAQADISVGQDGRTWIIYMHQSTDRKIFEIRVLRGAQLG